jgi:hypothetical protein
LFNLIEYLKVLSQVDDIREINGSTFNLNTFYDDYINEFLEGIDDETVDTTKN